MADPNILKQLETMSDEDRQAFRDVLKRKPRRGLQVQFHRKQQIDLAGKKLWVVSVGFDRLVLDAREPDKWPVQTHRAKK